MAEMIEPDSAAGESPETSLYQVLSQGKRSAGPPVAPPPPEPQPVVGGLLEVVVPASVAVAGGLPPGSSGACADVQAASRQARSRRVMVLHRTARVPAFFRSFRKAGGPSRIRTCGLRIRSPTLYPTELWALTALAEREGFEPSIQLWAVYWFSKPAP